MDVQVSSPPTDQSSENDEGSTLKIDEPELVEEEEQFYDAGENAVHNSSDVASTDLNYSVANEDLPTDVSDHSEPDIPISASQPKRPTQSVFDNLDEISTEGPSSVDGNISPQVDEVLFNNDNEEPQGSKPTSSSDGEPNEDAVSQPPSNDDGIHQYSTEDFSPEKAEKSGEDELSREDDVKNSSKSSIEVMEDESDSPSSKRSSPDKVVPNSNAPNKSNDADVVEASVENSTEPDSEIISENNAPLDSVSAEENEKVSEANEILTMDDSDVDESLQENLDVAIKVVEESQSSPVHTSTLDEPETKTDDCTNNDGLLEEPTSKSESILEEFQADAAKVNGDSSELLDSRLCPCQVVLFRIDFDEYALKYLKNKTETLPSSSNHDIDPNLDTSLSKASGSNSSSESSFSKTPTKVSPPKRRVLTKAARKMIPSPESIQETPSPRLRSTRTSAKSESPRTRYSRTSADSESHRPRRQVRDATAKVPKYARSNSSDSDDVAPKTSLNGKRKAVANGTKRSARTLQNRSFPQRTSSRKRVPEEVENSEADLLADLSGGRTLKCVSLPVITHLIDSLKDRSCSELMALIERKENTLPSRTTKSKLKRSKTVERSSRRRKLSSSDASKSSVDGDDYKTYGKMWKHDEGTSREENNFSLRSAAQSTSNQKSPRRNAKARKYVEDSESDDEVPSKKAKTRSRDSPKAQSTPNRKSSRKGTKIQKYVEDSKSDDESPLKTEGKSSKNSTHDTNSDDEPIPDSPKAKSTSNKRPSRKSAKVQKYVEDSKFDDESPLKENNTNRKNSTSDACSVEEDSPKAKSTSNKRPSRKSTKVQNYVEDSKSDDESPLKEAKTSRKNSTHAEGNEENGTDSDDEKTDNSPKAKTKSSNRSSRKSAKRPKYVEDSESDNESPPKEENSSRKNSTHVERNEKLNSDSDDEKADESSKVESNSESNEESPPKKETTSRESSIHAERNEKNDTDSRDEKSEDSREAKSTSNKRPFRKIAKELKYADDSDVDDEPQSKKAKSSRKNSTLSTDDEKADDSPKAKSSIKRTARKTAKSHKYVEDSESDDESASKKEKSSRKNSTDVENDRNNSDIDDDSSKDSSSETDNPPSRRRTGSSSSSRSRTRA